MIIEKFSAEVAVAYLIGDNIRIYFIYNTINFLFRKKKNLRVHRVHNFFIFSKIKKSYGDETAEVMSF